MSRAGLDTTAGTDVAAAANATRGRPAVGHVASELEAAAGSDHTPLDQGPALSLVRDLAVPALIRVGQMLAQLVLVAAMNRGSGNSLSSRFSIWDAQLYAEIVRSGYPDRITVAPSGALTTGDRFAFSPLYPGITWLVHTVTGLAILDTQLVVSWVAGCVLAVLVHLIVRASGRTRRSGYVACWLIGLLPMAVVLQMGYAEALCAALSAGALLAAVRGRWLLAGALAFLAGLARPTGFVAGVAVACVGLRARSASAAAPVTVEGTAVVPRAWPVPGRARLTVVAVMALASMPLWLGFVAARSGHLAGWFQVQRAGWDTRFDFGDQTVRFVWSTLVNPNDAGSTAVLATLILLLAVVAVATTAGRDRLPFTAVGALTLVSVIGSTNYWHCKPRLLLTGALLVVPLGTMLGTLPLRRTAPLLLFGFLASAWFGAYMLTGWHYGI